MTYSIVYTEASQTITSYETAVQNHKFVECNIALLDQYITKLALEKEQLLRHRTSIVQQIQHLKMLSTSIGKLPVVPIAQFLSASDICNFGATSRHFHDQCSPGNKLLLVHLTTPRRDLSLVEAEELINGMALAMVESIVIEAKRCSGKVLMRALSGKGSYMVSLRSVKISAAAETGDFIRDLLSFMEGLSPNQLVDIHFSGLRSLEHVSRLIAKQTLSIERFKVDYFVNGHEKDIRPEFIPIMPRLKAFVFDVADVVELPISLISDRLSAIQDKEAVEVIYLPHMQIAGESSKVIDLVNVLKQFKNVRQLVVRFRHLPLSVKDIVVLREAFDKLPAVCISDHFIVMLDTWASWWPQQNAIWDSPDKITGLSVFREQIDFESLGTTANREWLKLSRAQKNLWSRVIAPKVLGLYLQNQ
jgi:hypothetical protein